ncbi:MAG: hypothetical protein M1812_006100 [Candelaria pacifica]|nr:MAG: hypothetical protein M1812_006100 [Candelaria pacifica]
MKITISALTLGFLTIFTAALPAEEKATCTTTLTHFAQLNLSPTTTIYAKTVTATSSVNCHGCALTITNVGGPGPVRHVTATVTDPVTTATTTVCSASKY